MFRINLILSIVFVTLVIVVLFCDQQIYCEEQIQSSSASTKSTLDQSRIVRLNKRTVRSTESTTTNRPVTTSTISTTVKKKISSKKKSIPKSISTPSITTVFPFSITSNDDVIHHESNHKSITDSYRTLDSSSLRNEATISSVEDFSTTPSSTTTVSLPTKNDKVEEEEEEAEESESSNNEDDEDDPWADVEDDDNPKSSNVVDRMRQLREESLSVPYSLTTSHLNETISRVIDAYHIIDTHFLPTRETWEKLLGLVTSLDVSVQPECFASYFQGVSGFRGYQTWAYRFLDVRGRFPESGTLHGKFSSFGEWEECLNLESPQSSATGLIVKSQYCMLEVKVPFPDVRNLEELKSVVSKDHPWFQGVRKFLRNYRLHNLFTPYKMIELLQMTNGTVYRAGLCVPKLCKVHEIENLLINLTYPIFKMPLQLGPNCYKLDDPYKFKPHQLFAMTIMTALIAFVILCTIIEFYNISYDRTTAKNNIKLGNVMFQHDMIMKPNLFLYSFSAITNTRSLLKHSRFSSLDSLKFLFMIYIHLYNYYNLQSTIGFVTLKRIFTTYPSVSMRNDRYTWFRTSLPFEPIFIISGLIIGFNIHQKIKTSFFYSNYFLYVGRLWIQFAITYIGSVLFIYLLPMMSQGPVWDHGMAWLDGCINPRIVLNGLIFISNYNVQIYTPGAKHSAILPFCNPPTWLTSALIQLLIIAPILVYIANQMTKRMTYIFFIFLIILGFAFNLMPYFLFGIKPDVHFLEFETLYETMISHSWYRYGTNVYIGCFLMGIMAGYLLVEFKVLLRFEIETTVLVVSFLLIQLTIAVNNIFWRLDKPPSLFLTLTWHTLIRFLGSMGFTSIFFLIASNRCSLFNRFLECLPLRIVSRLAYSYFMVHILVVFYRIFSTKEVHSMSDSQMLQNFLIDVLCTLILAYIFYCMIECPCVNLLNWSQGKIFYDVEHIQPNQSKKSSLYNGTFAINNNNSYNNINNNNNNNNNINIDYQNSSYQSPQSNVDGKNKPIDLKEMGRSVTEITIPSPSSTTTNMDRMEEIQNEKF
ncbi:hypothetical protein SSS_06002 [Sarcoptes scabiei]|nr:hypothetical protein SSS_06002 [Sarcoptes scabiei]